MMNFKMFKNSTLRGKLTNYFLIIIVMMFSLNIFLIYNFKTFYKSLSDMQNDSVSVQSVLIKTDELYNHVSNYCHSGSMKYVRDYTNSFEKLFLSVEQMKSKSSDDNYAKLRNIKYMLITFDERATGIINMYDSGIGNIYINESLQDLSRVRDYIHDEVKGLLVSKLSVIKGQYSVFWGKIKAGEGLNYILTAIITVICIVFAFLFSKQISVPIHQLGIKLKKVAKGDLEVDVHDLSSTDEINVLIQAFNYMITQIKLLIERIKEKANIETQLKEQEIKNLEMKNLLNQSELNFLQTQINPHFLFNTLNSITALADIEEASQTRLMIESMSNILEYNLRRMNHIVTLRDEVNVVKNYLYIQKIRHGNRLEYSLDIDNEVMDYCLPSMVIQPFVENSIMHGLEPKEGGGYLEVGIHNRPEYIEITIKDNGIGIPHDVLEQINRGKVSQDYKKGIGVINVVRRLEIHYGTRDVIKIESTPGEGTTTQMRLPKVC